MVSGATGHGKSQKRAAGNQIGASVDEIVALLNQLGKGKLYTEQEATREGYVPVSALLKDSKRTIRTTAKQVLTLYRAKKIQRVRVGCNGHPVYWYKKA